MQSYHRGCRSQPRFAKTCCQRREETGSGVCAGPSPVSGSELHECDNQNTEQVITAACAWVKPSEVRRSLIL